MHGCRGRRGSGGGGAARGGGGGAARGAGGRPDAAELVGGASSGSEDEEEEDVAATGELPAFESVALATAADAEQLLDAVAIHAARPTSMWGCCGGVGNGRHYYCDTCNLYFHEVCQKNQSKGRQAPLCPPCHERALEGVGGGRTRRRVG